MHDSVLAYAHEVLKETDVQGGFVLEVGSQDVNGSVRPIVEALGPGIYFGVDAVPGPGVNEVVDVAEVGERFEDGCDLVICTEMLEHVREWDVALENLIEAVKPGGLLLITTRSEGFPYHAYPEDHWRYSVGTMAELLAAAGLVLTDVRPDPQCPGVLALAGKPFGWSWPDRVAVRWEHAGVSTAPEPDTADKGAEMADDKDKGPEVPYQQLGQLKQVLAARAVAEGQGNVTQVESADKQLRALGFDDADAAERHVDGVEARAAAGEARAAKAAEDDKGEGGSESASRTAPPAGRTTSPKAKSA